MSADPKTLFDLSGRVACVTGASSGLGQQAASALAAAGAQVIGVARRAEALSNWAERIGPKAATLSADLSERSQIKEIAAQIATPFGAPDILVHAAGINTRETADNVTNEGWDISLNLNLATPFFSKSGACAEYENQRLGPDRKFRIASNNARVSGRG